VSDVEFCGERFRMAERVGLMPMMRFAKVAKAGVDSDDLDGLAAMYDLLEQCIADDEWARFQAHADKSRADGDELMTVVKKVFEVLSERPTRRPSDSSVGPRTTEPSSTDGFFSQVIAREEAAGRPDRALILVQAQEARAAS
jgi:hypothetical protein